MHFTCQISLSENYSPPRKAKESCRVTGIILKDSTNAECIQTLSEQTGGAHVNL